MNTPQPLPGPPPGVRAMAIVRWTLVVLAALAALFAIASYIGLRRNADGAAQAEQLYHCPMHPQIVQDHLGDCPICSMSLVPLVKHAPSPDTGTAPGGLAAVELAPDRVQLAGMRTAVVKREALAAALRLAGVVAANERNLTQITTRYQGWVESLGVAATGERVRKGQVLARVFSPELLKAQQELLVARGWGGAGPGADADQFTSELGSNARHRLELLGVSRQEIDELLRTGQPMKALPVRSPVEGFVIGKRAVVGLSVEAGTVLFDIADLSDVWITAEIYELDIARVRLNQPARFEATAFPGEAYVGRVQFIHPVLDGQSRTLRVRLEFKNRTDASGPRLRPGMYGTVELGLPPGRGLMVPAEAVVDTGEQQYVFVSKPGGRFEPRVVKVGARGKDKVELQSGVSEGETVVTTGNFLLDSESRLRAAIEGAR